MPVTWGVIGCGGIANLRTIPEAMLPEETAELVGVTDLDPERRNATADRFGVKAYANAEELLSDPAIDAVYLPVPPAARADLAVMAAGFGKHVLCEKPMAMNGAQCEEMVLACRERNVTLGVGFMMRFHACHRKMRQMIDNGDIGRPVAAHVRYCLWSPPSDGKGWGHDPEIAGGGPLQNQGSHAIDILNMMFGPIQAVSALCDNVTHSYAVEDMDTMLVKFENGAHGALDIWAGVPNWRGRRLLEVFGSEGVLVAEETMGQLPTGRLWYQKAVDGGGPESEPEEIDFTPVNTYRAQIRAFSEAIAAGRPYEVPGEQGLHVQRVIDAAYLSAAEGRRVAVDPSLP
jgi:predicted dehydrogenase